VLAGPLEVLDLSAVMGVQARAVRFSHFRRRMASSYARFSPSA
jgi:hypothetical protein